jgi:hypothetical protein
MSGGERIRCNTVYSRDEVHTLEQEMKVEACDMEGAPE